MRKIIIIFVLFTGSFLILTSCSSDYAYQIESTPDGLVTIEAYQEVTIQIKKNNGKVEDLHLYPGNNISFEDADIEIVSKN